MMKYAIHALMAWVVMAPLMARAESPRKLVLTKGGWPVFARIVERTATAVRIQGRRGQVSSIPVSAIAQIQDAVQPQSQSSPSDQASRRAAAGTAKPTKKVARQRARRRWSLRLPKLHRCRCK